MVEQTSLQQVLMNILIFFFLIKSYLLGFYHVLLNLQIIFRLSSLGREERSSHGVGNSNRSIDFYNNLTSRQKPVQP